MDDRSTEIFSQAPSLAEGAPVTAKRLRRNLSSFEVLLLTLSCLSPVLSIFGIGADTLHQAGTGAGLLFGVGILAALVWAVIYAEVGSAFPYAGGDYVGIGSVLGGWAGVATLAMWAATSPPSCAFTAETLATYAGQLAPAINPAVFVYGSLALGVAVALLSVRTSALVTGVFLAIEMAAVVVMIAVGAAHPVRGLASVALHPVKLNAAGILQATPIPVLALGALTAVYATVGGNQALYFGEELRDPHRRMGPVVIWACMLGAVCTAIPVVILTLSARDLPSILASPAPFTTFIARATAPWVGSALSACVVLAVFNANIASIMQYARFYFSLGRDGVLPEPLGRLLSRTAPGSGAPRIATLVFGLISAACCSLSFHTLIIFMTGSLVYGWSLMCLAALIGRRKGLTGAPGFWRSPLHPLAPILGLAMAVVFTAADLVDADAGRPSLILLGAIILAALIWYRLKLKPRGWTPTLPTA